jgi:hypothetical protein
VHDRRHAALERAFAGEHLIEYDAGRIDVGPGIDRLAHELLGRHVGGRAHDGARLGHAAAFDAGDAEIGDLHLPFPGEHDVGRLDVAVDDAALMAELQAGQQRFHDPDRLAGREALVLVQQGLERGPVDELHHDVGELVGLAVVEDANDVGMGQAAGGLGLALEAGQFLLGFGVGGVGQSKGFDRHPAVDDRVVGVVDGSHGTLPQDARDLVLAELAVLHPTPFRVAAGFATRPESSYSPRGAGAETAACAGERRVPPSPMTAKGAQ